MQEEISLREIIDIFWSSKWLIFIGTSVVILVAAVVNFYILEPKYEAVSTLRVGNVGENKADISSFVETARNDVNIKRMIDKLGLDQGESLSISSIRQMIAIDAIKDTNVIRFRVKGKDAHLITSIANLVAFETGARIEISDLSTQIVSFNKSVLLLKNEITSNERELAKVLELLRATPEKQTVRQSLANDPYVRSLMEGQIGLNERELALLQLESESINPVYTMLDERKAQVELLMAAKLADKENLEVDIQEAEAKIFSLEQLMREKLDAVSNSERLLNGANAIFVSPAIVPTVSIGPRSLFNILIAAIVGFMMFLVIGFLRHYIKYTSRNI